MMNKDYEKSFSSWIPTNLGEINPDFISKNRLEKLFSKHKKISKEKDELQLENINLSFLSDSSRLPFFKNRDELEPIANINIEFCKDSKEFKGETSVTFINKTVSTEFSGQFNGSITFNKLMFKNTQSDLPFFAGKIDEIRLMFYTLIKLIIHGDNHHHQKIDTVLELTINNPSFNKERVITNLLTHIKALEFTVKNLQLCSSRLKSYNTENEVEGYISYLKTFCLIFEKDIKKDIKIDNKIKIAENILISIKAKNDKRKNKKEFYNSLFSNFIAFLALFISINIFINNFYNETILEGTIEHSRKSIGELTFYIIFIFYLIFNLCNIGSIVFYKYYHIYEDYFYLSWIKYKDIKHSNKKNSILFYKNISIILFIIGVIILFFINF